MTRAVGGGIDRENNPFYRKRGRWWPPSSTSGVLCSVSGTAVLVGPRAG